MIQRTLLCQDGLPGTSTATSIAATITTKSRPRLRSNQSWPLCFINKITPEGEAFNEAVKMGITIATNDRIAVDLTKKAINRTLDIMGMRQALLQALELDVVIEASETPESREFNEILEKEGSRAAIAWREARMEKATRAK